MGGSIVRAWLVGALALAGVGGLEQGSLSHDDLSRADAGVRAAFSFLYELPSDTSAASMGSWVRDSAATTSPSEPSGQWRIVVTQLTDTGQGLELKEMVGEPGTSPAQLAAAMVAMQQLEAKVSKAEAEASLELVISLNASETAVPEGPERASRRRGMVPGSHVSERVSGYWKRVDDRELETSYERWSPATLLVRLGSGTGRGIQTITVRAQGNEEMIDRVINETRWDALARLIN